MSVVWLAGINMMELSLLLENKVATGGRDATKVPVKKKETRS